MTTPSILLSRVRYGRIRIEYRLPRYDAVVNATMHRMRPILLTAAAAILGLIPIAGTVFWGPMAFAMMEHQAQEPRPDTAQQHPLSPCDGRVSAKLYRDRVAGRFRCAPENRDFLLRFNSRLTIEPKCCPG